MAWMHCQAPLSGRVQITNANVFEVDGVDYRRKGIGTALYDLIESEVVVAGAEGLEPHWGSLSGDALAFWQHRRPDYAEVFEGLNRLGTLASGLYECRAPQKKPPARDGGWPVRWWTRLWAS